MSRFIHLSSYLTLSSVSLGISLYREHGLNITLHLLVLDVYLRFGYNDPQIIEEFNSVSGY
jgi:hypothetical protein